MTRRRTNPDQLPLDFEGGFRERMACLRAQLAAIDPGSIGLTPGRWSAVREVVQALFAHAGASADAWCSAHEETLAAGCEVDHQPLTVAQWRRYRTLAATLGLAHKSPWRGRWRWRVDLGRIEELAADGRESAQTRRAGPVRNGAKRCEMVRNHKETPDPLTPLPNPPLPLPNSAPARTAPDHACGGGWGVVVAELARLGLAVAGSAADAVRSAGGTPEDAHAILGHWRAHGGGRSGGAWGPGALVLRLRRWAPGQDPAAGWPPPDPAYEARVAAQRREAQRRAEWARQERARAERAERLAALAAERRASGPVDVLGEYRAALAAAHGGPG